MAVFYAENLAFAKPRAIFIFIYFSTSYAKLTEWTQEAKTPAAGWR